MNAKWLENIPNLNMNLPKTPKPPYLISRR
jgi:hypothetical protein